MSMTTKPLFITPIPWEEDTTTTMGARVSVHTYGGRTVEPTHQDKALLLGVALAGNLWPVAWPKLCERAPNERITASYMLTVEVADDYLIAPGDAREFASPSAALANIVGVSFAAQPVTQIVAHTELGKRLLALRQKIIASGAPLLDWSDLDYEVESRRGERD